MRRMGIVNCALSPLEPNMWTRWNTPDEELFAKIGPGEVTRAVAWSTLTPEQKSFQRTKMAIHAAMITRMDWDEARSSTAERWVASAVILFCRITGAFRATGSTDGHDRTRHWFRRSFLGWAGWSSANAPFGC
jgi:arylsulfatase